MNLNELPRTESILPGIKDLHQGQTDKTEALRVAIAATRLSAEV
ncbi:MAG: hypothetical protein ACFB0E_15575 [Leptolyngbyaceae cyanobacterium]